MREDRVVHLASRDPLVFSIQAMIVAAMVFTLSYVLYIFLFGRHVQTGSVLTTTDQQSQAVAVDELVEDGVDESEFFEGAVGGDMVNEEALQGLFPALK